MSIFLRSLTCSNILARGVLSGGVLRPFNQGQFLASQLHTQSIKRVKINNLKETVQVDFDNGTYEYPWLFLQDNCTCPKCFHQSSRSRLRRITEMNLSNVITGVEHQSEGDQIVCKWADGHISPFSKEWLLDRNFSQDNIKKRTSLLRENPVFVGSDHVMKREKFQDVLTDDKKLVGVLKEMATYGVCFLEDAPKKVDQLQQLAKRIGYIRTTHYGDSYTVKSEANAQNLAYTASPLNFHTDLPYYAYPPGTQYLHCIKQFAGDGGISIISDGFAVADQMKHKHPKKYKTLVETPLEFMDIGEDFIKFNKVHRSPTFVVNPESGKMMRIAYNNMQLSSYLPVPVDQVQSVYDALKTFTDLLYDPKNLIRFKLKEGDIMMFDNWRMLHGREGFDIKKGSRHLEGIYIDWDEVFSRIRVIEVEMSES